MFEITGHWYYGSSTSNDSNSNSKDRSDSAKCFFAIARPYPSKNAAMLDSFLELKFENERLRQELLVMYKVSLHLLSLRCPYDMFSID